MKKIIVVCGLLLLGMAACDRTPRSESPQTISWLSLCPDFATTGKAPVAANAQCGHFDVKENPQDSASKNISLKVLRLPAVNPVPAPDPLFIIAGGPGQSAVTLAETVHHTFNEVRKNRDIIFVDQRGTGGSNAFDCAFENDTTALMSPEQQQAFVKQATAQCVEKYRDHFAFYTTPYAVADLDAVRAALGYPTINLWGGSYGSRVVLEYLRRYGDHARAAVIDGVAPVDMALPWFMEADGLAALQAIAQQCDQTPLCAERYGNVMQKAREVSDALASKVASVTFPHPRTQGKVTLSLTAEDFASILRLALYNRELSSLLPQVISDARNGDYQLFASLIYLARSKSDLMDINFALHYSVACSEDYPRYKDKDPAESNVFLQSKMVQKYREICSQWPVALMPDDYWQPVAAHHPVLILSGAVDPVTPPHWGDTAMATLPQARHLVAPGGHHIITQEGCTSQLIALFIAKGEAKSLDGSCIKNIEPLAIHIPPTSGSEPATAVAPVAQGAHP